MTKPLGKTRSRPPARRATKASGKRTPPWSVLHPLPTALLTQPARRDRAAPHLPDPVTWRRALQNSRDVWQDCRQLLGLTVATFREYLAKDFRALPLEEKERRSLLKSLSNIPTDDTFWRAVQEGDLILRTTEQAMEKIRLHPAAGFVGDPRADESVWSGKFFRSRLPSKWRRSAVKVLAVLHIFRYAANAKVEERSWLLRTLWEQGHTNALLAAVQEELPALWVTNAIAEIERQHKEAKAPQDKKEAKTLLNAIRQWRSAVGKGDVEHLSPVEKPVSRRAAVGRYKAGIRLLDRYGKWMKAFGDKKKAFQQTLQDFEENSRIKDSSQKKLIIQRFAARRRTLP